MNFTNIPFGIEFNNNVVERRFIAEKTIISYDGRY